MVGLRQGKTASFSLWVPDHDGKEHPEHLLCQRGVTAWHRCGIQRDSWDIEALWASRYLLPRCARSFWLTLIDQRNKVMAGERFGRPWISAWLSLRQEKAVMGRWGRKQIFCPGERIVILFKALGYCNYLLSIQSHNSTDSFNIQLSILVYNPINNV